MRRNHSEIRCAVQVESRIVGLQIGEERQARLAIAKERAHCLGRPDGCVWVHVADTGMLQAGEEAWIAAYRSRERIGIRGGSESDCCRSTQ